MLPNNILRQTIMEESRKAGASHIGSALSCLEILEAASMMEEPKRIILSKGHAAAALYAINGKTGFEESGTDLWGHPTLKNSEATTGSLGHGLPMAVGMAYAGRETHIYCIVGDGEMNEGSNWEALQFIGQHNLNNLTIIIDTNGWQGFGKDKDILGRHPLAAKIGGFGLETTETDGHDVKALLAEMKKSAKTPKAIIAKTIKGKGWKEVENTLESHYKRA